MHDYSNQWHRDKKIRARFDRAQGGIVMLFHHYTPGVAGHKPWKHTTTIRWGKPPSDHTVYTVGHGARSAAEFVDLLRAAAIGCIADVRSYPVSRRHPQFSQKTLAPFLDEYAIDYCWLGKALGGFRHGRSAIHPYRPGMRFITRLCRSYVLHGVPGGIAELLVLARSGPRPYSVPNGSLSIAIAP